MLSGIRVAEIYSEVTCGICASFFFYTRIQIWHLRPSPGLVQENVVGKIGWSFNTASHVEKSHSVIAEIFLRDLISYFSHVWPKVRNFVAYENHTGIPVYVTPPLQYGVRKSANARVRNIDAYENFCDYSMSSQVCIYGIWLFLQKKKKVDLVDSQKEGSFEEWGLFTQWRRSGSAGHFCTRMHAGCMAGCLRPRKTHLRNATFCPFCLDTVRVILTDDLCVQRTWKIKPQKEFQQDISIFRINDSEKCRTQNNRHGDGTTLQSGDTDCGCWRQATPSLGFCFPLFSPQKRVPHLAFWLFWFCVCGYWLLSPSFGHLASARSG